MTSVPDIAGEIVGFRAWGLDVSLLRGPWLLSLNGARWPRRAWMVAECECGMAPGEHCSCGIYAARDRLRLANLGYNERDDVLAIGEVGLAGKVVVGTQGWRAEKARPRRLWVPHIHWRLVRPLGDAYGVPVALSNLLAAEA